MQHALPVVTRYANGLERFSHLSSRGGRVEWYDSNTKHWIDPPSEDKIATFA